MLILKPIFQLAQKAFRVSGDLKGCSDDIIQGLALIFTFTFS